MDWQEFFISQLEQIQPYQPGLREEQVRELVQTEQIHKLSSNEPPYPPFPAALAAMTDSLPKLNRYSDGSAFALKGSIAAKFGVRQEQVMVGNGANELLSLLAQACLDSSSRVAYCAPSFVVYKMSAQIAGAACDELPLTSAGSYDLDGLLAAVRPQTKLVYICSPNNPSGGIVTQRQFLEFAQALPGHVLLVLDMVYSDYVLAANHMDPFPIFDGQRPLVILRSFSKIYGLAGLRVGFGIAPEPVVQAVDKLREPFNVNTLAQVAARASLADDAELARRRDANAEQRARLYAAFDRLGLSYYRSQANFVWVHLADPQQVFTELMQRGVIVRPFAESGGLRISVGTAEDTTATIQALQAICG